MIATMSAGITLEVASARLTKYLEAEEAVLLNQSYEIAGRRLTRADLSEIRLGIEYWDAMCSKLESNSSASGCRTKTLRFGF